MHPFPQLIPFLGIYPKGAVAGPYSETRAPSAGRTVCTPSGDAPLDLEVETALA